MTFMPTVELRKAKAEVRAAAKREYKRERVREKEKAKEKLRIDIKAVEAFLGCSQVRDVGWHAVLDTIAVKCEDPYSKREFWQVIEKCRECPRSGQFNVKFTGREVLPLLLAPDQRGKIPEGVEYVRCRRLNKLIAEHRCHTLSFCSGCEGPMEKE